VKIGPCAYRESNHGANAVRKDLKITYLPLGKIMLKSKHLLYTKINLLDIRNYIFSLIIFTVDNKHLFTPNYEIQRYSTRNNSNLHLPTINLSKFYKGPYISGTKAFNHLPQYLKLFVSDVKCFKISLKRFLYHHSFYSVKEYYEHNKDKDM